MVPASRIFAFAAIVVGGCAADLGTKAWIFRWPPGPGKRGEWWLVENFVGIQQALNEGALFGFGQGFSWLFATLSIAAFIGVIVWLFVLGAAKDRLLTYALALVCGGILGNLYDRLGLWGGVDPNGEPIRAVRDWILFCYYDHIWPNFNIADCLLVCGAGLLALHAFRPAGESNGASDSPRVSSPVEASS